jgi:hypothetical protein
LQFIRDELALDADIKQQNIRIAKVDCTVDKELCTTYDVAGFPTLKLFENGKVQGYTESDRAFEPLKKFAVSTTPSQDVVHYTASKVNEPIKVNSPDDV